MDDEEKRDAQESMTTNDQAGQKSGSNAAGSSTNDQAGSSSTQDSGFKEKMEQTSRDRVAAMKQARDAAMSETGSQTAPLQGVSTPVQQMPVPPVRPRSLPALQYPPPRPSTLPLLLKRMSYLLSFILGAGAITSLFWSTFLLPLLHSSFSARKALVDQQSDRISKVLTTLRSIRSQSMYPQPSTQSVEVSTSTSHTGSSPGGSVKSYSGKDKQVAVALHKSGIEEIPSSAASSSSSHRDESKQLIHKRTPQKDEVDNEQEKRIYTPLLPIDRITTLTASLRSLSEAIDGNSITRQSLLSTLESYTALLHREMYLRNNSAFGARGINLNTLGQNLAQYSSHGSDGGEEERAVGSIQAKPEEWDMVRKEVRAIKGMLLGRRNFTQVQ